MATNQVPFISPEEYLEIDSEAERPSEYWNGRMAEIEASSENHSSILVNLITAITVGLRSKNSKCKSYAQPLRVHMPKTGLYAYPDFIVARSRPVFELYDTLLNPTLIMEVLSPSTQDYNRGGKFASYRSIPSLEEYWTVAQDCVLIERWTIVNQRWTLTEYSNLGDVITRPDLELAVGEVYRDIEFAA